MSQIISIVVLCICLSSCAEFYFSNTRFFDKDGNQIVLTNKHIDMFYHGPEISNSPCIKLPMAYYFEKDKHILNGCWKYENEKIVFIAFDNSSKIFTPQWTF